MTTTPEAHGAVGNGTTNDTAAFQAALNTGKTVVCQSKNYRLGGSLTMTTRGQHLNFNGAVINLVNTSYDLFNITGGADGRAIYGGIIDAHNHSNGCIFNINHADRTSITDMIVYNPFNFSHIARANLTHFENCYINNIRGSYGFQWDGVTHRSDILRLIGVNLSTKSSGPLVNGINQPGYNTSIGIDWVGDCHTLQLNNVTMVDLGTGIKARASGSKRPLFLMANDLEVDYTNGHAVELLAGEDFYFNTNTYIHGSRTGSGIYTSSSIPSDRTIVGGGKFTGHARYGVEGGGRTMIGNIVSIGNGLGTYSFDNGVSKTPRLQIDSSFYFNALSNNPAINWHPNAYDGFNRTSNTRFINVSGKTGISIGDGNDPLKVRVADILKQLTQGDLNSGGSGYRLLRVPN